VIDGYDQYEVLLEKWGRREIGSRRRKIEHGEVDLPGCELGIEPGVVSSTRRGGGVDTLGAVRSNSGTSHRAVVPMIPIRTVPATSWVSATTSDSSASSSASTRLARATTTSPASVS